MNVKLRELSVNYGRLTALDKIDLDLPRGSTGLLGVNGAGKTSLIKALLGLIACSKKDASVLGKQIPDESKTIRALTGYMPENDCLIPGFNGLGMVQYAGELAGMRKVDAMQRAHEVLFYVGLEEARYRKVETYSAGMKQRIKLAQALIHDPKLLFLDEPTNGMDPRGREEMLQLISDISARKDMSVILSSHLLVDVEKTCENVVILHQGKVIQQGKITELKGKHGSRYTVRIIGEQDKFLTQLHSVNCDVTVNDKNEFDVILPSESGTELLLKAAIEADVQLRELKPGIQSLEDVFVKLIGENKYADL